MRKFIPKAYVFDAYGTLFDVHSVSEVIEHEFPGKSGTLSGIWRAKQIEYTWLRSLYGNYIDFWEVTRNALVYACRALDLPCSNQVQERLMAEYLHLSPYPEVKQTLDTLSGNKCLAILSNGSPMMLSKLVENSGIDHCFSQLLSVDKVRIYKPSPLVYELASRKLGIAKNEIGFVSANYWDIAGAKSFGFYVYWLNRNNLPADELNIKADEVIPDISFLIREDDSPTDL